jgi:hypothetical protein
MSVENEGPSPRPSREPLTTRTASAGKLIILFLPGVGGVFLLSEFVEFCAAVEAEKAEGSTNDWALLGRRGGLEGRRERVEEES